MYDGSKSDESGSTRAPAGENGLDRAASKGLADSKSDNSASVRASRENGSSSTKNHASAES